MNVWLLAVAVLIGLGLIPTLWLASTGDVARRLVGFQLSSALAVLALTAFCQAVNQPSYLIVPLTLAVMGVAGTFVFTRLLGPRA